MYWPEDAWAMGNPDLLPEQGRDWDAGIRLRWPLLNTIAFDLTWFSNRMDNLIIWQMGSDSKWRPENVEKADLRGMETSLTLTPVRDLLSVTGNYTYLIAENLSEDRILNGKRLVYRPANTVNLSATLSRRTLSLTYQYSYVGRRFTNPANTISLEAYRTSDATLTWTPHRWGIDWTVALQGKNLLDEPFEIIQYQPIPGREFRVTLGMMLSNTKSVKKG